MSCHAARQELEKKLRRKLDRSLIRAERRVKKLVALARSERDAGNLPAVPPDFNCKYEPRMSTSPLKRWLSTTHQVVIRRSTGKTRTIHFEFDRACEGNVQDFLAELSKAFAMAAEWASSQI